MGDSQMIAKIRPFASFQTVGLLLVLTGVLFLINLGLGEIAKHFNVVTTAECTLSPKFEMKGEFIGATVDCSGTTYPLLVSNDQLLSIANSAPSERAALALSCSIYSVGNATCELPYN